MFKNYRLCFIASCFALLTACQATQHMTETLLPAQVSSDETVSTAVHEAFAKNKALASLPIQINAMNGTVLLSGYVKTIRQSDTAGDVAAKVPGVKMVQNHLIVRK